MIVYVESNFVLEAALEQEQGESCEELLRIASTGAIRLIIPAFSLAEPHIAPMRRGSERSRLVAELQKHLSELGRSKTYRAAPVNFGALMAVLITSAGQERAGLQRATDVVLKTAEIIPLDSGVFNEANGIQLSFDMPADAARIRSCTQEQDSDPLGVIDDCEKRSEVAGRDFDRRDAGVALFHAFNLNLIFDTRQVPCLQAFR